MGCLYYFYPIFSTYNNSNLHRLLVYKNTKFVPPIFPTLWTVSTSYSDNDPHSGLNMHNISVQLFLKTFLISLKLCSLTKVNNFYS